jgi:NTP pyrophosphatase (non-canonical NTP hydrolase)
MTAAIAARTEEWDAGRTDLSFRGNELAGEVGEACNIIKKLERERLGLPGSRATVEQLADELADAMICIRRIAYFVGIADIEKIERLKFNETSIKNNLKTRVKV